MKEDLIKIEILKCFDVARNDVPLLPKRLRDRTPSIEEKIKKELDGLANHLINYIKR